MKILEVKYMFRRNLGNFEHEEISMVASVEHGETAQEVLAKVKDLVHQKPEVKETEVKQAVEDEIKMEEPPKKKPGRKPKSEVEPESKKEAPVSTAAATTYSRESDLHKKLLGELLTKEFPNWKANPKKAKDASIGLEGAPFLNSEGSIVDSFVKALKEKMA